MSHDITVRLFRLPHLCVFEIYGELLSDTEMAKGAAVKGIGRAGANAVAADDRVTEIKTLSDMGITKAQVLLAAPYFNLYLVTQSLS